MGFPHTLSYRWRIYHFIDSLLLYQLFQAVKVPQGDGTALELTGLLRELLEHPRHGLPCGADMLGDLFMGHADRIRAGALRFGQEKARQPPVKALNKSCCMAHITSENRAVASS